MEKFREGDKHERLLILGNEQGVREGLQTDTLVVIINYLINHVHVLTSIKTSGMMEFRDLSS